LAANKCTLVGGFCYFSTTFVLFTTYIFLWNIIFTFNLYIIIFLMVIQINFSDFATD
jgi:uncharacterized membrane protein